MADIIQVNEAFRHQLLAREAESAAALLLAYRTVWTALADRRDRDSLGIVAPITKLRCGIGAGMATTEAGLCASKAASIPIHFSGIP